MVDEETLTQGPLPIPLLAIMDDAKISGKQFREVLSYDFPFKKLRTSYHAKHAGEQVITEATPLSSLPPMSPLIPPPSLFSTLTRVHTKCWTHLPHL